MIAKLTGQILILSFLILLFNIVGTTQAFAQRSISEMLNTKMNANDSGILAKNANSLIGSDVYVCDIVTDYNVKKKQVTKVVLGNKVHGQNLAIIFKEKPNINPKGLLRSKICLSGVVVNYKGGAAIIVSKKEQFHIQILL